MDAGNAFLPDFILDYNRRFGRPARNPYDAPLRDDEDLARIFTWREERRMSRNLVVHFKRVTYLIEPRRRRDPWPASACRCTRATMGRSRSAVKGSGFRTRSST